METRNLTLRSLKKLLIALGKTSSSILITSFQFLTILRIFPKKHEIQALMKYYDTDGDGSISYDEFIKGLKYETSLICRDPLNDRRKNMVERAF
jgi:hypothetical protein